MLGLCVKKLHLLTLENLRKGQGPVEAVSWTEVLEGATDALSLYFASTGRQAQFRHSRLPCQSGSCTLPLLCYSGWAHPTPVLSGSPTKVSGCTQTLEDTPLDGLALVARGLVSLSPMRLQLQER